MFDVGYIWIYLLARCIWIYRQTDISVGQLYLDILKFRYIWIIDIWIYLDELQLSMIYPDISTIMDISGYICFLGYIWIYFEKQIYPDVFRYIQIYPLYGYIQIYLKNIWIYLGKQIYPDISVPRYIQIYLVKIRYIQIYPDISEYFLKKRCSLMQKSQKSIF